MATDYDAPRRDEVELGEDSIEELKSRRVDAQSGSVDVDEAEVAESFELPGADLADEELTVRVVPMQADEFRCSRCFLVHHRSQLAARAQRRADLPRVRLTVGWPQRRDGAMAAGRDGLRQGRVRQGRPR